MKDLHPRASKERSALRQRTMTFLKRKRPVVRGQRWADWARELLALEDAKCWNSFGGPLHPTDKPMSQARFRALAQVDADAVYTYRTALRVMDAMSEVGMGRNYADLLRPKTVAKFAPFIHDPELLTQAARAAARSSGLFREFQKNHARKQAGKAQNASHTGHRKWWTRGKTKETA